MCTAFLNSLSVISTTGCYILLFTCLEKAFHVGSATFTTENFKCMVRLRKFSVKKILQDFFYRLKFKEKKFYPGPGHDSRPLALHVRALTTKSVRTSTDP